MSVFELAKGYYPRLWGEERIRALAAAGRLTDQEVRLLLGEKKGEV